ncbi:MAG: divergent polysaccharide deacetylase family protein [Woeseiaceae bacterium]
MKNINKNIIIQNGFPAIFFGLLLSAPLILKPLHADSLTPIQETIDFNQPAQASISIIIDDMGYKLKSGLRAVNLPGAFTYSFLPHSPHAIPLSESAHQKDKEIMLHLPMQSISGKKLGPGGLLSSMTEQEFDESLSSSINSIPHIHGFNNHMGSLLTKSQLWMTRLMRKMTKDKDLFFVDSKTTNKSIALQVARSQGIQSIPRDIFIDHEMTPRFIKQQLSKLIKRAKQKGTALAIAHPKTLTLSMLEKWLPTLKQQGINLIPVSQLIQLKRQGRIASIKPYHPISDLGAKY